MVKVSVIGATGYAGEELVRVLLGHKKVELVAVSSVSFEGRKIAEIYPNLRGVCDLALVGEDEAVEGADVVFAALPHGLSEALARKCLAANKRLIDLGADFRLKDAATYEAWYKKPFDAPELHEFAAYCIPELHATRLTQNGANAVKIVANPGCYPTASALALAPVMTQLIPSSIIIDAKSGITGAGRGLSERTHFPAANEGFEAYGVASHRHTPEIEQTLSELARREVRVVFTPHLLPLNRGILATIYAQFEPISTFAALADEMAAGAPAGKKPRLLEVLREIYCEFYKDAHFVRVLPLGACANVRDVRGSNFCDISLHFCARTQRLIITSAIDNMFKGAASQAVQNLNLLCGFDEREGIDFVPSAF